MSAPDAQTRYNINLALEDLIEAVTQHELWGVGGQNSGPGKTLYLVWDTLNRTKYLLSEYENIQNGRPVQYPDQIRLNYTSDARGALKVFNDACGRTMMTDMIITDTSPKQSLKVGGSAPVDFGPNCIAKNGQLMRVIPKENLMAGMMGGP